MEFERDAIKTLVKEIKAQGLRTYVSKSGTYGIFTDHNGSRVVSFQIDCFTPVFSGNYKTTKPSQTGTGWRMDTPYSEQLDYRQMLHTSAPMWALGDAKIVKYTTAKEHLAMYESSGYTEV